MSLKNFGLKEISEKSVGISVKDFGLEKSLSLGLGNFGLKKVSVSVLVKILVSSLS